MGLCAQGRLKTRIDNSDSKLGPAHRPRCALPGMRLPYIAYVYMPMPRSPLVPPPLPVALVRTRKDAEVTCERQADRADRTDVARVVRAARVGGDLREIAVDSERRGSFGRSGVRVLGGYPKPYQRLA